MEWRLSLSKAERLLNPLQFRQAQLRLVVRLMEWRLSLSKAERGRLNLDAVIRQNLEGFGYAE